MATEFLRGLLCWQLLLQGHLFFVALISIFYLSIFQSDLALRAYTFWHQGSPPPFSSRQLLFQLSANLLPLLALRHREVVDHPFQLFVLIFDLPFLLTFFLPCHLSSVVLSQV